MFVSLLMACRIMGELTFACLVGVAVTFLAPAGAVAEPFAHQRSILPGPRAAAFGGAFVAIADDPSAVYWNPAGYSFIDKKEISVSGLGMIESSTSFERTINDQSFIERAQSLTPGFFGTSLRKGPFGFGYGFSALEERHINQNDSFSDVELVTGETVDYYRTYQESSTLSAAGAGISALIFDGFSLGISAAYYRRQSAVSNFQIVADGLDAIGSGSGGAFTARNFKYETLNEGLLGTFGMLLVSGKWRFGFSYRHPVPMSDNTIVSDSTSESPGDDALPGSTTTVTMNEGRSSDLDEPRIVTYQLGVAWGVAGRLLLALDGVRHQVGTAADKARELRTTDNWSAGLEAGLVGGLLVRGGVFTNASLYPEVVDDRSNQPASVDYTGQSFGLALTDNSREIAVTYVHQSGSGRSQLVADSYQIQSTRGTLVNVLLSTRIYF